MRRQVRVHRERRPGVDDLGARARASRRRPPSRISHEPLPTATMRRATRRSARRSAAAARDLLGVRVAVERLRRASGAPSSTSGERPPGRLVGGQLDELAAERVGLRRRVDRDRLEPAVELDAGVTGRPRGRGAALGLAQVDVLRRLRLHRRSSAPAAGSRAAARPARRSRGRTAAARAQPEAARGHGGELRVEVVGAGEDAAHHVLAAASALRSITSRTSSSVASRIASASLSSTVIAPRSALNLTRAISQPAARAGRRSRPRRSALRR